MSLTMALTALVASTVWWIHTFLGKKYVHRPIQNTDAKPFALATTAVCWHMITYLLGLQALVLFGLATGTIHPVFTWVIPMITLPFLILFLITSVRRFPSWASMPQPWLFLAIGLCYLLALAVPVNLAVAKTTGLILALILTVLAMLHVFWAGGSTWPARNHADFVGLVVGLPASANPPGRTATALVATGLFVAAGLFTIHAFLGANTPNPLRWGTTALVAIFALRGLLGFLEPLLRPGSRAFAYDHWNRVLYSPLCLFMAGLGLTVAVGLR